MLPFVPIKYNFKINTFMIYVNYYQVESKVFFFFSFCTFTFNLMYKYKWQYMEQKAVTHQSKF